MSSLNWSLFANVGLLNLFTGSYSANAICQGRGSPSEKWIREYLWYTSTLRRIVTNVLLYRLYIHSSGCISILSYRQPKKRTIATLSLSLQSLRPILRYIYIYTFHGIKNNALPTSLGPTWLKMIILQEFGEQLLLFQWVPTILAKVKPWYVSQSRVLIVIPSDSPDFVPSTNHSCLGASGLITDILGSSR